MRKILLSLSFLCFFSGLALSQTSLQGKVSNAETGEELPFATIKLTLNGVLITGTDTDFDGNYSITGLEPGTYDVEASFIGFTPSRQVGVVIKAGKSNKLDFGLSEGTLMDEVVIVEYKVPLVEQDNTTQGKTVTAESIRSLPTRSVAGIAATSAGMTASKDGNISVRGSRTDATYYYIDGIRVRAGSVIPTQEIEQLQVITGGIEAKYGDVTGGIISITSKGPSSRYTGGLEMETSEYLDDYGHSLIAANVSGPLLKKDGKSLLGFRFSGQYRHRKDDFPSAVGVYRASEETIAELEANPVSLINNVPFPTGETLDETDISAPLAARPNEDRIDINLTGKLDARLSDNIDVSLSGSYNDRKNKFAPDGAWNLLNWTNNPTSYTGGYRGNFRFRHKLGSQGYGEQLSDEEKAVRNSSIRNANYSIQLGYEKRRNLEEDARHEDNFFNYGYYGNQARDWETRASLVSNLDTWGGQVVFDALGRPWSHQGFAQVDGEFTIDQNINPTPAQFSFANGVVNGTLDNLWSGLYSNAGRVYNRYEKGETDIYTINVTSGFDFLPGGSESGTHNIQIGFTFERSTARSYVLLPQRLYNIGSLQANRHIIGVDTTQVVGTFTQDLPGFPGAEFNEYQALIEESEGAAFYQNVRNLTGQSLYEYVNVDGLAPDQLTLDLFAASELTDQNIIGYYGYDYLGNKIPTSTKFDDFFSGVDDSGRRTFNVAPIQPLYGAFYVQDKFTYKDIIFRLGLRMDYYDANTKVLKDPYALYEIETADAFFERTGQTKPDAVGDDYKVYVTNEDEDNVIGYRKGDTWYLPNGTSVGEAGNLIFDGTVVYPAYVGRDGQASTRVLNIQDKDFETSTSFDDYTPQLNWMPRAAFSFPISEDANFFAHYDVLVQRPAGGTNVTALNYYYFEEPGRTPLNNANLRPEKTIDWEAGFQQKVSQTTAVKISAFYKELRDMIQRRTYTFMPSPINNYESRANLDFGTVKGFSLAIDRRRTNNLELSATYTLQFAKGTGSDINSSNGINSRGPIRNLLPFSYDERHRITATVDYRYGSGKKYTGPRIGGMDIFANTGVNFLINAVSGRPYTRLTTPAVLGGSGYQGAINGSRLPWQFSLDARIDKQFNLTLGGEGSRSIGCNVYFRVSNLLDTKNVVGVYPVTGDPDDDGFLASSIGQDRIRSVELVGKDTNAFLNSYQWRVLSGGNYAFPRQIFVGAIFDF